MYLMLALFMGFIWRDLPLEQGSIQDRLGSHFFSVAFLCFMSVAAIPALIEDRIIFVRERANGKYSTLAYVVANFTIALLFVFIISLSFSVPQYFLTGPSARETAACQPLGRRLLRVCRARVCIGV